MPGFTLVAGGVSCEDVWPGLVWRSALCVSGRVWSSSAAIGLHPWVFFLREVPYVFFNLVFLCLYLWPGFFVTAVTPVLSNQRAAVLRQGGHVLSRQFRYYVPDFSGRMVVQTPIIVRWVPILIFHFFLLALSAVSVFLSSYCCWLLLITWWDGLVLGFVLISAISILIMMI